MKTLIRISSLLVFTSVLFMACQKEVSFEKGNSTASVGSLAVDGSGNCLGAVVSGTYMKDTALKTSNYVDVSVQVDTAGSYTVSSDTVNGYYFKATGSFNGTGSQVVRLVGGGKPLAAGTNIFTVTYNGTVCEFTVTVTAAVPPGGGTSVFTVACTGATPAGTYMAGTPLTASNTVTLNVNVTTVGTWSVTTAPAVNGVTFSGTGTFAATGAQTIILTGSGTPTAAGPFTFTVTGATATCTFQSTFAPAAGGNAVFTVNCAGATPAGTYAAGTPLTAANTITLNVNVTTIGTWSVTTAPAMNGVIFSGTGTFATTGAQTIILTGSGTPTAAGPFTFTVTGATATCTFQTTFTPAAAPDYFPRTAFSNWSYEYDGDPDDSLLIYVLQPTVSKLGNTFNIFMYNDGIFPADTFGYYRKAGADYYEYGDMSYGVLDEPFRGEFIFLKDNQTVGTTWNSAQFSGDYTDQNGTTGTITLRWKFTILQQNVSFAVTSSTGTVSYADTIEVKQELEQLVGATWTLIGYFRNYFARDKGLVKQDFYNSTNSLQSEGNVRRFIVY